MVSGGVARRINDGIQSLFPNRYWMSSSPHPPLVSFTQGTGDSTDLQSYHQTLLAKLQVLNRDAGTEKIDKVHDAGRPTDQETAVKRIERIINRQKEENIVPIEHDD